MTAKSIHFLIDGETNPVTSSRIRNVSFNTDASDTTGGFVVRVDEALNFEVTGDPGIISVNQLITAKFTAIFEAHPGFANSVFDDLLDATGIDSSSCSGCRIGGRNSLRLNPGGGGEIRTTAVALGGTPSQAIVTWEAFTVTPSNDKTSRGSLSYGDRPSSEITTQVSFNNGATFQTVTDGGLQNIAVPDQGSNLILKFQNPTINVVGLASWTVVY